MGTVVVSARRRTRVPRAQLFAQLGSPEVGGWLFGCRCDALVPGAAVSLTLPLAGAGQSSVDVVGRVARVRAPEFVEIVHDQPWRGRLVLKLAEEGGETVVALHEELDESGLRWLMHRRGHAVPAAGPATTPLGLLTSKSGSASLFGAAVDAMAQLAQDEINAEPVAGVPPVEVLVGDDATDAATGVAEARRLVAAGCRTVLVATASHTYREVVRALHGTGVLVVYAVMNEGGGAGRLQVRLGERPASQLAVAAPAIMRATGARRWFLAGNDYCWPEAVHAAARRLLPVHGGHVAGEARAPLGTTDFAPVVDRLAASGADLVLSTFVGTDGAAFQRQLHAAGLADRVVTLAPALDEATLGRIGEAASQNLYGVSGYLSSSPTAESLELQRRYRERFGPWAAPLSTMSESVYEAVLIWWSAVRAVGAVDPVAIADQLRTGAHDLPRGRVVLDGTGSVWQRLQVSRASGTELRAAEDLSVD